MPRFIRALIVSGFCLTYVAPALGDTFSLYYEADGTFPEQEGWSRWTYHPDPAHVRTVADGVFSINSMASPGTADVYRVGGLDLVPGSGQLLRVDWRTRVLQQDVDDLDWFGDATMLVGRSNDQYASFNLGPAVISALTPGYSGYRVISHLEAGAWHTYSLLTDMQHYDLYVDGQLLFQDVLYTGTPETPNPRVSWGDSWSGAGSQSQWDYVRVSIVPEPGGLLIGAVAVLAFSSIGR
jgi:hypothetical protein